MINIKNNELLHKTIAAAGMPASPATNLTTSSFSNKSSVLLALASSENTTAAAGLHKATANVPFFKNPHKTIAAAGMPASPATNLTTSSFSNKSSVLLALASNENTTAPLAAAAAGLHKVSSYKPNLIFLQKKGSQIPNPSIINYNFPGSSCSQSQPMAATANVYKLLFNFFKSMYCLISKPVFITTPDKIKIQLFYFLCIPKNLIGASSGGNYTTAIAYGSSTSNLTKVYPYKFKLICTILSKFFNKNVELELIRLHQPYYDSNILVNFLALIINKKNIGACIQRLYNSNIIKANSTGSSLATANANLAYLSGLNIKISGRLMREPIIPRITTKKFEKGFTAKGKINYFDLARFTHKNRKGAFTITVKSGQNF